MSPELTEAVAQVKSGLRTEENIEKIQRAFECGIMSLDDTASVSSIQEDCIEHITNALKTKSIPNSAHVNERLSLLLGKELKPMLSHRQALLTIVALLEKDNV